MSTLLTVATVTAATILSALTTSGVDFRGGRPRPLLFFGGRARLLLRRNCFDKMLQASTVGFCGFLVKWFMLICFPHGLNEWFW